MFKCFGSCSVCVFVFRRLWCLYFSVSEIILLYVSVSEVKTLYLNVLDKVNGWNSTPSMYCTCF